MCNALQDGLPICSRPFDDLAKFLDSDEKTVLQEIEELKKAGVIRRINALINYRAIGMTGTLVAAHIPEENLREVTEAVNSLRNVSHNYLRKHYYNLWFTLQARRPEQIKVILSNLSGRFGIDFYSLPVEHIFKLDARFDTENEGRLLGDVAEIPKTEAVELSESEKLILSKLQNDLEVISKPFNSLCGGDLGAEEVLRITQELIDKGVIRRIAAVVDHRKLGFVANVLFAGEVSQDKVIEAGKALARFGVVSHCYERKALKDWPYNLFAMMHGRSIGEIQRVVDKFTEAEKIDSYQLLPTTAELKKQPVKHQFH